MEINYSYEHIETNIIKLLSELVAQKSWYDELSVSKQTPFGINVHNGFELIKKYCAENEISYRNVDNYALEIELGDHSCNEDFGILVHVDTVPIQKNWNTNPLILTRVDNKLFGLGANDNKGPLATILTLVNLLNKENLKYKRKLKIVIGGDEERTFSCLQHYFKHNKQMTFGVSPDASFPGVFFEKGLHDYWFSKDLDEFKSNLVNVIEINAGTALNVVPQYATCKLKVDNQCKMMFENKARSCGVHFTLNNDIYELTFQGTPAHASEVSKGVNAINLMLEFLKSFELDSNFAYLLNLFDSTISNDLYGHKLGVYGQNEYGHTTINFATMSYVNNNIKFSVNIRFTNKVSSEELNNIINKEFEEFEIVCDLLNWHYISKSSKIYNMVKNAYESTTSQKFEPIASGGATYARMLENGLAFGPNVENNTTMHQKNEYITTNSLELTFKTYLKLVLDNCIS